MEFTSLQFPFCPWKEKLLLQGKSLKEFKSRKMDHCNKDKRKLWHQRRRKVSHGYQIIFLNAILEKTVPSCLGGTREGTFCFPLEDWYEPAHLCQVGHGGAARTSEPWGALLSKCWLCKQLAGKLGCVLHTEPIFISLWQKYADKAVTFS